MSKNDSTYTVLRSVTGPDGLTNFMRTVEKRGTSWFGGSEWGFSTFWRRCVGKGGTLNRGEQAVQPALSVLVSMKCGNEVDFLPPHAAGVRLDRLLSDQFGQDDQGFWQVVAGRAESRSNGSRSPEVQATCCTTVFQLRSAVPRKNRRS